MALPPAHPSGDGKSSLLVWLISFAIAVGALAVSAGSSKQRRPHFWLRVLLIFSAMPLAVAVVIASSFVVGLPDGAAVPLLLLLVFLFVPALFFVPSLLYHESDSPPGSSEDEGGGWRPGPDRPLSPPDNPRGDLPHPDAEQARVRVRDHTGPEFERAKPRRPAKEPEHTPAPLHWGSRPRCAPTSARVLPRGAPSIGLPSLKRSGWNRTRVVC